MLTLSQVPHKWETEIVCRWWLWWLTGGVIQAAISDIVIFID